MDELVVRWLGEIHIRPAGADKLFLCIRGLVKLLSHIGEYASEYKY